MKKTTRFIYLTAVMLIFTFTALLIAEPEPCRMGAINGILLCGRVIIPSLFPFTMCVLFIMKSGILKRLEPLSFLTNKIFGLSAENFSLMLLSFIGGYPVGAKLLNEAVSTGRLSAKKAGVMLNYCVNAGPAFIIAAVGVGLLRSKPIGIVLLASHIFAAVFLLFIFRFFKTDNPETKGFNKTKINPADNFVLSSSEAAQTVFGICSFVILFSCINSYIVFFSQKIPFLKAAALLLEVTNGVTLTNNLHIISFLLGFGGISVWCQVFAVSGKIKKNYAVFILSRILHGLLSTLFTAVIIKLFRISYPVFSNNKIFSFDMLYSTPQVGISLIIMGIIFAVSLSGKKSDCKILDDMV